MHRALSLGLTLVFLLGSSASLLADIRPPTGGREPGRPILPPHPEPFRTSDKGTAPVVIKRGAIAADEKPVVAKILLPRSLVREFKSEPAAKEGGSTGFDIRTLIAGLSLSGAAVCGLFVIRGKRSARWVAAGCVALAAAFGAWSYATADIPPPPRTAEAKVIVELVDGTDTVTILTAE